jgi:predicted GIY-YIG superfamily endonuclease
VGLNSTLEPTHFEKVYRVYVIQNPDGKFYIGMSENVETHTNAILSATRTER